MLNTSLDSRGFVTLRREKSWIRWRKGAAVQASELAKRMKSNDAPPVIDVRSGIEFKLGHVPGAINAPTLKILLKMAHLPKDKNTELVITCEHGPRALMAQRLLAAYGYRNTTLLEGHMAGWKAAGLPLEK
ncbi:MAG: rhodanese-like domain-containing protein [Candidatus Acidiferrum sp.]